MAIDYLIRPVSFTKINICNELTNYIKRAERFVMIKSEGEEREMIELIHIYGNKKSNQKHNFCKKILRKKKELFTEVELVAERSCSNF